MCDALPVMKARKPDLRSLVNDVAKERHSSLYVAMAENHAALSDAFTKRRPNWKELIVGFADLGLTDADGNAASVRTAQQTWYRVCREKMNQRSAKATFPAPRLPPPLPPIKPGEIAPGVRPVIEPPIELLPISEPDSTSQEASVLIANIRRQMDKRSGR